MKTGINFFLRDEARRLGYQELTLPKAMLETNTELRRYDSKPFATLHAELAVALYLKTERGVRTGEIGVSKSCFATCTQGISALGDLRYNYTVRSSHANVYVAQLTEFSYILQC